MFDIHLQNVGSDWFMVHKLDSVKFLVTIFQGTRAQTEQEADKDPKAWWEIQVIEALQDFLVRHASTLGLQEIPESQVPLL